MARVLQTLHFNVMHQDVEGRAVVMGKLMRSWWRICNWVHNESEGRGERGSEGGGL